MADRKEILRYVDWAAREVLSEQYDVDAYIGNMSEEALLKDLQRDEFDWLRIDDMVGDSLGIDLSDLDRAFANDRFYPWNDEKATVKDYVDLILTCCSSIPMPAPF